MQFTCFAMPKSANLISPLGPTNMFAPLMSLQGKANELKKSSKNI